MNELNNGQNHKVLPWKGETDWGNFPTGCSIYLYPDMRRIGVYYLNANKRTVQDQGLHIHPVKKMLIIMKNS